VLVLLALSLALCGRLYCAVICPLGLAQDVARGMFRLCRFARVGSAPVAAVRYALLALFPVAVFFGLTGLFEPYGIFGRFFLTGLRRLGEPSVAFVVWAISLFAAILLMTAYRARWWCNQVCPVGTFLGLFSRFAYFRVRVDRTKCVGCGACVKACDSGAIERDGKTVPAYKERLNRQYLPPYYVENGAFFVSRRSVVTPTSRFGAKIRVFVVPADESVDVDTYEDLATVSMQLSRPRVAFYVNGNNRRGLGHMYRVLELADEFYVKPDIYFDENQTDVRIFGTTTHNLIPINGIGKLLSALEEKHYDIFINDILGTSLDYMIAVRTAIPNAVIVNFEDDGEGAERADLVFNALFSASDTPNVRAGERYYIAPKLFMFYKPIEIRETVSTVFISFGGADPQNYSDRLIDIVSKDKYRGYRFKVVLGRAKLNAAELLKRSKDNVEISLDVKNMPEIMTACDIGITSRGRTGYELALLGIPSIAMAQNAREERHGFVCEENGFAYLGLNPSDSMIEGMLDLYLHMDQADRRRYQALLLSHDLRDGRKRVMNLINGCR